jgi:PAS domain S-box-containing protein
MSIPLRVLIVEDSEDDAQLLMRELKHGGFEPMSERVETAEALRAALAREAWDVVISDHTMPGFSGPAAFKIVQDSGLGAAMRAGAHDYMLKGNLARLVPAIQRELREAEHRRERKRAEVALRESEQRYRVVAETATDGIITIDENSTLLFFNPAVERIFGYSTAELQGQELTMLMPEFLRHLHRAAVKRYIDTGKRHITWQGVELPGRHKSGAQIPLELSFGEFIQGDKHIFTGILRDITERKRAEEALRKSEEQYRLLFENNPQPMWVFDRETLTFLAVNEAAIQHYGYSREEFLTMTIKEILPPEDVPKPVGDISGTGAGLDRWGEWRHQKKDGTIIDVEIASHPLFLVGRPAELVLARDISERKHLEQQLYQAQKMEAVGQLAGGVAHDFNNLLTVISGYCQMLLEDAEASGRQREYVAEIKEAGDRAAALTRQLLAFSRQQVLQPRVLDLNGVIANMENMLRRLIGEDVELVAVQGPDLGLVKADPGQVEQIIMNLAVNARDAMPKGGKLTIETANVELDEAYTRRRVPAQPGVYVMLAVSDTGIGMDSQTQSRIFEPFFTTKEQGKGTGLGLSTVYGIVKQSGGYVWVYSEPGKGTTFKVYLPRSEEKVVEKVEERGKTRAKGPEGAETVLLLEDEERVRKLAQRILEAGGYRVLVASRGEEAVQMCKEHQGAIHLLLTDMVMPQLSGRDVASQLSPLRAEMRVLYMSGYTDNAVVRHGMLEPGMAFLQKPFTPETLLNKVREVLDS